MASGWREQSPGGQVQVVSQVLDTCIKVKDRMSELKLKPFSDQCCGFVTFWYGFVSAPLTNGSGSGSCYFRA